MTDENQNMKKQEITDAEIDALLRKAAKKQREQADTEGIIVSEELIAKTMQRIEAKEAGFEESAASEPMKCEVKNRFRRSILIYSKQIKIAGGVIAAVLAVVFLFGSGTLLLSGGAGSMEGSYDTSGMESFSDNNKEKTSQAVETACPEEVPLPETDQALNEQNKVDEENSYGYSGSGSNSIENGLAIEPLCIQAFGETVNVVTDAEGIEPQLLYDGEEFRELIVTGENGAGLQIVFDYPQNFVYSCGRKGDKLYLLVTRRIASDCYEHQLLLFDFAESRAETEAVVQKEKTLLKWISLQDETLSYECEN
ncbi:MAG: hypothetical protein ACI4FZ_03580 [Lachnospiraceae bacterium]